MRVTFPGLLTVVFIVLKLTHQIAWSWWWVLSPLLIPITIWIVCTVVAAVLESKKTPLERNIDELRKMLGR